MTTVSASGWVEFRFFRTGVRQVLVSGDFNGWCTSPLKTLRMKPVGDGWWTTEAYFEPGEYRFKYVADGIWYTDFASNGIEPYKAGANSILVVPERSADAGRTNAARMVA
jgi:1,4-alpha-glucan branching enzyme